MGTDVHIETERENGVEADDLVRLTLALLVLLLVPLPVLAAAADSESRLDVVLFHLVRAVLIVCTAFAPVARRVFLGPPMPSAESTRSARDGVYTVLCGYARIRSNKRQRQACL